ncbi:MAG: FadR/GntR family transcriptional regulator [Bacillota bacterium]
MTRIPFSPIERDILAVKVARQIVSMISTGRLKAGDRLPPERELASELGVGRPAVREALRALQMMNILEVRHGDGTYVTSLQPGSLIEPYRMFLSLGVMTIEHLFEARRVLEAAVAEFAAQRITQDELAALRKCISQAAEALDDPRRFLEADLRIHSVIAQASRNPVLMAIMESIGSLLRASRELTVTLPGVRERALSDHRLIVDALEARDAKQSSKLMAAHVDAIRDALTSARVEVQGPSEGGGIPISGKTCGEGRRRKRAQPRREES